MSDLKTVLIEDARLSQISDEIAFGVSSGANQSSYQQFTAVSSSSSSVVFNVIVPSEAVAIDKNIQLRQTINLKFRVANVPEGEVGWSYGCLDAFQAFPFNSLMTTANCSINNASISTNVRDVLPSLVRMCDSRDLQRYRGLCPCLPDTMYANLDETYRYQNYNVVMPAGPPLVPPNVYTPNTNSQLGNSSSSGLDNNFVPRGSFPLDFLQIDHYDAAGVRQDSNLYSTSADDTWTIQVSATTTEPLMCLSPFTSNMFSTNQGALIGINNMNFNFNIDSSCSRVWSTASYYDFTATHTKVPYITSITLGNDHSGNLAFTNNQLLLNFLTLQPHQYAHIKSKNLLPYYDTPRYLSNLNQNSSVRGWGSTYVSGIPTGNYSLVGASGDITSTSLQLNIVPDYLIITVRKPMANQNITDPNGFLIVNKMSLSFNNSQGLLSQMTQQDLWRMSVRNGSSQTWEEFSGRKNMTQQGDPAFYINTTSSTTGQNWVSGTCGSMIVISPNDLNMPDFLAGSSLGQFQVFFTMNVTNQYYEDIVPEICVIAVNSGIMTTIQGQSVFNTGILTKQQVLEAKQQAPIERLDTAEYARLVGGHGMDEKPLSALKNLAHRFRKRHAKLDAGATSGGHSSGGRMSKYM